MIEFIIYHTPIFYLIQSVWRDEAFSFFMAKPNLIQIIINTAHDFNPPLYYLLLHLWIIIVGKSDEGLRLLSFIPHLLSVYIMYKLASKLFSNKFALFVSIFTFFNPMLLYYAFEMRMYSIYAFFTLCSLYFFYNKNWRWYIISTVLGLYSHSFFPLIIFSYIVYLKIVNQLTKKNLILVLKPVLFYLPWLPLLFIQFLHSKESWMFPVDLQLIKSVLGNLFTNYEGTPGDWWMITFLLSIIIVIFFGFSLKKKMGLALLWLTPIFIPLFLILGYSIFRRPIYVNRYMIFITIYEIVAISQGIWNLKNHKARCISALTWLLFVIIFNIKITPYHKKTDFKNTFMEININAKPNDYVFAKTPIGFLESAYYYRNPNMVFTYNPQNIAIPKYIGTTVVFPNASKTTFPSPPSKTFLIADDASYELVITK